MRKLDHPVVACSAGADSGLLTDLSFELHPETALAVFAATDAVDERERRYAQSEAALHRWRLDFLTVTCFGQEAVFHNRRDRCYHCKKLIYKALRRHGEALGGKNFTESSNGDDALVFRPGSCAVTETGFLSPLAETHFTKAEVRRFGAERGLNSATKASAPCLLTRFPYDLENGFDFDHIHRIKTGEHHLKRHLFDNFRLRFVDTHTPRIEVSAAEHGPLERHFDAISPGIPFARVILNETPFESGSFDRKAGDC